MKVYWLGKQLMNKEGTLIDVYAHPRRNEPEWNLMSNDDLKAHNEKLAKAAIEFSAIESVASGYNLEEHVDYTLKLFLQSPEYKALVGEV